MASFFVQRSYTNVRDLHIFGYRTPRFYCSLANDIQRSGLGSGSKPTLA